MQYLFIHKYSNCPFNNLNSNPLSHMVNRVAYGVAVTVTVSRGNVVKTSKFEWTLDDIRIDAKFIL